MARRFWWVNQNQTYRHERAGGYLWSPKRKANGARNLFDDFNGVVAPGDVILSFVNGARRVCGVAVSP